MGMKNTPEPKSPFIYLIKRGEVPDLRKISRPTPKLSPTKVGLSRTHSEKPPYPGGMHKQGFPRGDGAKSRETYTSGLRLRTEKNLSSMRLSNLILADFNALLRRSRVPSCLPRLLETHTEYGFLFVSLSTSPTLLFSPSILLNYRKP